MTAAEVLLDLLSYVGIKSFRASSNSNALNRPGISQSDINAGIAAINGALQEINEKGPQSFKYDRRSAFLYGPTAVVLNVTHGLGGTFVSGQQSWMLGCSILVAGDPYLNEIIGFNGSAVSLQRGFTGATSTDVSATVYCDASLLESDVSAVVEPVEIPPNRRLRQAQSRAAFDRFAYQSNSGSAQGYATSTSKTTGTPILYLVDSRYDLASNYLPLYLRVNPMPSAPISVVFSVERKCERVDAAIYSDDDSDPGYEFTSVPADWVERILLPIARQKFTSHPAFKNATAKQSIANEYKDIILSLQQGEAFNHSRGATRALYL